jgi:molecular chaperone HscB
LRNPFKRAAYLCELNGVDLQIESNTAMPTAFLMQQMEWREALDEVKATKNLDGLERLEAEVRAARKRDIEMIGELLDANNFEEAGKAVRQLMFLEKFGDEIGNLFEAFHA